MDALVLTAAEAEARIVAIRRLQAVADEMAWFVEKLRGERVPPAIAQGPLALSARAGWMLAQVALIQADAGIVSPHIVERICDRDAGLDTPALRCLALSTLEASHRRLRALRPSPCEPQLREAAR